MASFSLLKPIGIIITEVGIAVFDNNSSWVLWTVFDVVKIVESLLPCVAFLDIQSNTIPFPLKIANQITYAGSQKSN